MPAKSLSILCVAAALSFAPALSAAEEEKLSKAEFNQVAVEGLASAGGMSKERAQKRFNEILDAARTYEGSGNLARQVRTGYGHYEKSKNIRKKHAAQILELFTQAEVASMSQKEADAVLSAWPKG